MPELKITAIDITPRMIAEALAELGDTDLICEFIRDMLDQDVFDPDLRYWLIDGLQGDLETVAFLKQLKDKRGE